MAEFALATRDWNEREIPDPKFVKKHSIAADMHNTQERSVCPPEVVDIAAISPRHAKEMDERRDNRWRYECGVLLGTSSRLGNLAQGICALPIARRARVEGVPPHQCRHLRRCRGRGLRDVVW
jgi:hypothetical protein